MNKVSEEFEKLKQDLIREYDAKGMRASGEFADSLEVEATEHGAKLWGAGHTVQLEHGRGKTQTSTPSNPTLREKIDKWVDDKNIQASDGISKDSLVFLITRKIHREGWDRSGYGGVGLISEVLTDARFDEIIRMAVENISGEFLRLITQQIRKI
ncbi:MAG TPA: hypothetical protein VLH16_03775 [Bacteroidales bacterium]|nr:hypothetical protein [Bacteroidales bacterium]